MSKVKSIDSPSVSVVIPTFNRATYVVEAVESVLKQENTVNGCEIIVVDDGSTDSTSDLLAPYASRIRYVYQRNAGPGAARNSGLKLADGEFVLFLDSDDTLIGDALSGLLSRVAGDPITGAVQGGWSIVDQYGTVLSNPEPWRAAPNLDLDTWVMYTPLSVCGLLCRKSWALEVGGFDTELAQVEDVDFVLRLALHGCKFRWLRRPVFRYRQHSGNITRNAAEERRSMEKVFHALFERPELPERIRKKRREFFFYRYAWFAWRLSRTGFQEEVEDCLRRSYAESELSPQHTVETWTRLFDKWAREVGGGSEEVQTLIPRVKAVVTLEDGQWQDLDKVLPWWSAIWSRYQLDGEPPGAQAWSDYQHLPSGELRELAKMSLIFTPVNGMVPVIGRFLKDTSRLSAEPVLPRADCVSLYLTAFGQAVMAGRQIEALIALGYAVRQGGCHPGSFGAWFRFISNAIHYARSGSKRHGL